MTAENSKDNKLGENFSRAIAQALDSEYENFAPESNDIHIFSHQFTKKMNKLIRRQKKPYYKFVATAGRRCACIMAGVVILSVSSLSVKAVREAVSSFFIKDYPDHAEITADLTESYPDTIEIQYEMTDFPQGYALYSTNITDNWVIMEYWKDDLFLSFTQMTKQNYNPSYDNERSKIFYFTDDNNQEYLVHEANTGVQISLAWDNGDYMFTVSSVGLDFDTMLKIAQSVEPKT